jgi:F0F1-type ATP synthase membrane subunit c/vacuolar-type H+-ATPase subunit K
VIDPLTTALYIGAGVLILLAGLYTGLDKRPNVPVLGVTALLEAVTLTQLVVGIVQLASTDRDVNGPVFVAYLLGLVLVLPLASVWAVAEKSRWGTGVLVIAGLVLLVLVARLQQLWTGVGV